MGAIAGAAISAAGMIFQGIGQSQADQFQAQQAERAAEIGKIQADQTDTAYRQDLMSTISNIRAIRAATGASADSPSSRAYIDAETQASDRVRQIKVGGLLMQSEQDTQDAAFFRSSAQTALLGGALGGLSRFVGAIPAPTFTG